MGVSLLAWTSKGQAPAPDNTMYGMRLDQGRMRVVETMRHRAEQWECLSGRRTGGREGWGASLLAPAPDNTTTHGMWLGQGHMPVVETETQG